MNLSSLMMEQQQQPKAPGTVIHHHLAKNNQHTGLNGDDGPSGWTPGHCKIPSKHTTHFSSILLF